ncbi:MAG: response regulator [Phycisphaerae bacterium]|jgi:PAS domain S-box-containing protein|nr:response regulator [Phycisphaerae bacterium]
MTPPRILVVEDDPEVMSEIQVCFDGLQYVLAGKTSSGAEAVELSRKIQPDLVLMDVDVGGDMSGAEAAGVIQQQFGIPVVYLGAYQDDRTVEQGTDGDPFGWVLKPFDRRDLHVAIEVAIHQHQLKTVLLLENEAHRAAEERYRFLYDQSPAIHIAIRSDGGIADANPALVEIIGYSKSQLEGRHMMELVAPEQAGRVAEFFDRVFRGDCESQLEVDMHAQDGRLHTVLFSPGKFISQSDDDIACILSGIEVTHRKAAAEALGETNQRLERVRKMETIGVLAGGFARHFNNMLTIIQGNAELLLSACDSSDDSVEGIHQIIDAVRRASDLTGQLMAYARGGARQNVEMNINELVLSVAGSVQADIAGSIHVNVNLTDEAIVTAGDPAQVYSTLLNLVLNACEAMPSGGELVISVEEVALTEDQCERIPHEVAPGAFVRISVCDTGIGMDRQTLERVFEPFFTTKDVGDRAGMGLAVVYGCAVSHQGSVDVISQPDEGTTVSILLPIVPVPVEQTAAPRPDRSEAGGRHVLVVDDEDGVLDVTAQGLRGEGYQVSICNNPTQALELYEDDHEHIDLVIVDMVMPDMSGVELLDKIRDIDPDVPVVLSSGFALDEMVEKFMAHGFVGFLTKPFKIEELLNVVETSLSDQRQEQGDKRQ